MQVRPDLLRDQGKLLLGLSAAARHVPRVGHDQSTSRGGLDAHDAAHSSEVHPAVVLPGDPHHIGAHVAHVALGLHEGADAQLLDVRPEHVGVDDAADQRHQSVTLVGCRRGVMVPGDVQDGIAGLWRAHVGDPKANLRKLLLHLGLRQQVHDRARREAHRDDDDRGGTDTVIPMRPVERTQKVGFYARQPVMKGVFALHLVAGVLLALSEVVRAIEAQHRDVRVMATEGVGQRRSELTHLLFATAKAGDHDDQRHLSPGILLREVQHAHDLLPNSIGEVHLAVQGHGRLRARYRHPPQQIGQDVGHPSTQTRKAVAADHGALGEHLATRGAHRDADPHRPRLRGVRRHAGDHRADQRLVAAIIAQQRAMDRRPDVEQPTVGLHAQRKPAGPHLHHAKALLDGPRQRQDQPGTIDQHALPRATLGKAQLVWQRDLHRRTGHGGNHASKGVVDVTVIQNAQKQRPHRRRRAQRNLDPGVPGSADDDTVPQPILVGRHQPQPSPSGPDEHRADARRISNRLRRSTVLAQHTLCGVSGPDHGVRFRDDAPELFTVRRAHRADAQPKPIGSDPHDLHLRVHLALFGGQRDRQQIPDAQRHRSTQKASLDVGVSGVPNDRRSGGVRHTNPQQRPVHRPKIGPLDGGWNGDVVVHGGREGTDGGEGEGHGPGRASGRTDPMLTTVSATYHRPTDCTIRTAQQADTRGAMPTTDVP